MVPQSQKVLERLVLKPYQFDKNECHHPYGEG